MGGVSFCPPRALRDDDPIDGFSCGSEAVDGWFSRRARAARRLGTAAVYVTLSQGRIAGFYTLSSHSLDREEVSGWLARNAPRQIPVILLGMLGVDRAFQGAGLGANLLLDAVHRAERVSEAVGARALVVDPEGDAARAFYRHHGFGDVPGTSRMYAKLR